jgi:hypothetical protein
MVWGTGRSENSGFWMEFDGSESDFFMGSSHNYFSLPGNFNSITAIIFLWVFDQFDFYHPWNPDRLSHSFNPSSYSVSFGPGLLHSIPKSLYFPLIPLPWPYPLQKSFELVSKLQSLTFHPLTSWPNGPQLSHHLLPLTSTIPIHALFQWFPENPFWKDLDRSYCEALLSQWPCRWICESKNMLNSSVALAATRFVALAPVLLTVLSI